MAQLGNYLQYVQELGTGSFGEVSVMLTQGPELVPPLKKVDICACNPSAGKGETEDPKACGTGCLANW